MEVQVKAVYESGNLDWDNSYMQLSVTLSLLQKKNKTANECTLSQKLNLNIQDKKLNEKKMGSQKKAEATQESTINDKLENAYGQSLRASLV